jgi:hypothetical protein
VPVPPVRPVRLRKRVFRGTWAVEQGLLTPAQLRSSAWRRLRRDVYADAQIQVTHRLLAIGASLVMPPSAVFGGLTAAVLWGAVDLATAADPVEVVVPPGQRWTPGPGITVRSVDPGSDLVGSPRWLRRTSRVRTCLDLARQGSLDESVVLLDRLVAAGVAALSDVRAAAEVLPPGRGSRQIRQVAALADGRAESPPETRVRLLLHRSSLPAPIAQYVVRHHGRFVARVDFAWPEHQLALEYDGLWHGEKEQFQRDRRRLNALLAAGWRVIFVTAADLRRPDLLLRRIAAALADRQFGSVAASR